ncbi:MAG: glycosyltransferase family 4 protein [Gemmatimonadota bacterium]
MTTHTADSQRALFLANRLPWPLVDGWTRRTFHVIRQLALKWPVHVIVLSDGDPVRLREAQVALGSSVTVQSIRRRPFRRLRGLFGSVVRNRPFHVAADTDADFTRAVGAFLRSNDVALIGCAGVNMAGYFSLDTQHRALHLVDTHNIDSLVVDRFASLAKDPLRRAFLTLAAPQMRTWEQQVFADADLVIVCSDSEIPLARGLAPAAAVHCIPNGADVDQLPPRPATTMSVGAARLLFFGRLDYFPNLDALEFLQASMLDELRRRLPGFRLRIVGAGDTAPIAALFRDVPEVEVVGFVDSIGDELQAADAVLVPLRTGGGTRLKILEAMAAGRPVISTTIGAEGIDATDGVDILLRDEPSAFVTAVESVIADRATADRLGAAARETIIAKYSWDGIGANLRRLVEETLRDAPESAGVIGSDSGRAAPALN